jgi:hypothetical protein
LAVIFAAAKLDANHAIALTDDNSGLLMKNWLVNSFSQVGQFILPVEKKTMLLYSVFSSSWQQ